MEIKRLTLVGRFALLVVALGEKHWAEFMRLIIMLTLSIKYQQM
jgi:hypothetical protein